MKTAKSLDEGLNVVLPLETVDVAFDEHNGKLVHLSGPLHTKAVSLFPASFKSPAYSIYHFIFNNFIAPSSRPHTPQKEVVLLFSSLVFLAFHAC